MTPAIPPRPALALETATRERLTAALAASKAPATRRAYRSAWAAWSAWSAAHGAADLPATPEHVAAYLAARAETGAGLATLRMAVAAIAAAHDLAGVSSPCADRVVRAVMQGLARQAAADGHTARQAAGLTAEAVATIRGAINGRAETRLRDATTMAIVSTMADAGLRRSEAAALQWRHVTRADDGSGRIEVRRSKTDQEAAGAVVAITAAALRDLDRMAALRGRREPDDSVFGLCDRSIGRRITTAAKAAGLGDGFSGHSGRVGMAQRMTSNRAPAAAVMRQGRWSSVRMVARYTRHQAAAEALEYL